jgi:hypothetical protein
MKKTSVAILIFNILFLCVNVKFLTSIWHANTDLYKRQAEQVIHEFINNVRNNSNDFSFDVDKRSVSYDPNDLRLPYRIVRAYPNGLFTPGCTDWVMDVHFDNGSIYNAEVYYIEEDKWCLDTFGKRYQGPVNALTIHQILELYVKAAHTYMKDQGVSFVDYNTIVQNHLVRDQLLGQDNTKGTVFELFDITSFEVNDTDTRIEMRMHDGYNIICEFQPLKKRNTNTGVD